MNYEMISDYKDNKMYRDSFNKLAESTFDINFEEWFRSGFWNDKYVCYSYIDNNEVISNVSINKMNLIYQGENYSALQIGTVMTHPNYRGQGLAKNLLNHVIALSMKTSMIFFIYLQMILYWIFTRNLGLNV